MLQTLLISIVLIFISTRFICSRFEFQMKFFAFLEIFFSEKMTVSQSAKKRGRPPKNPQIQGLISSIQNNQTAIDVSPHFDRCKEDPKHTRNSSRLQSKAKDQRMEKIALQRACSSQSPARSKQKQKSIAALAAEVRSSSLPRVQSSHRPISTMVLTKDKINKTNIGSSLLCTRIN